jgi:trk system potassium uptake protein TrkH
VSGALLISIKTKHTVLYPKDGFAIVAFSWVSISFFGALPFYISGSVDSFMDCLFESVSGFTTTGATILTNIESLPNGLIFWRSFTNWLGGMGVLLLLVALLPSLGAKSSLIVRAETPGPNTGKILPKMSDTAKVTYIIYLTLSALLLICLLLAGMSLFDAMIHMFSTAGLGGFSNTALSIGVFQNPAVEVIITVFMMLFGVNFMLYYLIITGNIKRALKSEELRLYASIFIVASVVIMIDISSKFGWNFFEAFRQSAFQTASAMSTTGFSTADYNLWPDMSKMIMLVLMLVGSCANSTGGAIKQIRLLLLIKSVKHHIMGIIHPRAVHQITVDHKKVDDETIKEVHVFFFGYMFIMFAACLIISLENMDIFSTFTAALASISNVGPGFGLFGPASDYSALSALSKTTLSVCMLLGRLEIFPIVVLFSPSIWLGKSA